MGKVMRHTLGASLNIRHNLSSSKGPKPLQLKDRKSGSAGMPETDIVCRLLLEKKNNEQRASQHRHPCSLCLLCLTVRRTSRSTLFPYTTLFRSITGVVEMVIRRPI